MRCVSENTLARIARMLTGLPLTASILFTVACTPKVKEKEQVRSPEAQASSLPYAAMAARIVTALQPEAGERVMLRFASSVLPRMEQEVRRQLRDAGAEVESVLYGAVPDFERRLQNTEIYIWLPADPEVGNPPEQTAALEDWLDAGFGRQLHFHWGGGTVGTDGLAGKHSAAYDEVYLKALDIDYEAMDRQMEKAIAELRSGEVHVTTPAGTDIRFRTGDRPFSKQNGDASKARMEEAKVRIDREIELPAGALRVAPLEESVEGTIVIPRARIDNMEVVGIQLTFSRGNIARLTAEENQSALESYLNSGQGLRHFREFALGFNPGLVTPEGEPWVAYYGYGAGVVRLSLGDNTELGGRVRGGGARWFFFSDATVRVGSKTLVDEGNLQVNR